MINISNCIEIIAPEKLHPATLVIVQKMVDSVKFRENGFKETTANKQYRKRTAIIKFSREGLK